MANRGPGNAHRPVLRLLGAFVAVSTAAGVLTAGLVMPAVGATGAVAQEGVNVFEDLPVDLGDDTLSQATTILYSDGSVMARVYEQNRVVVPLDAIAPVMQKAIISIEDHRFYEHGPVDLEGIGRAFVSNLTSGSTSQGASTLTQQYVKNVLVEQAAAKGDKKAIAAAITSKGADGYARKLREMKMAVDVEEEMSKDEILTGYLNITYFANQVYGVEAASRFYFNKPARDLLLPEAALLAGLVQDPNDLNPLKHPDRALQRRNLVLKRMLELGHIPQAEHDAAVAAPLPTPESVQRSQQGCMSAGSAAYFCNYVTAVVRSDPMYGKTAEDRAKLLRRGGLTIRTTLDRRLQDIAKAAVDAGVNPGQAARTATSLVQPRTGQILAMAQNTTYSPEEEKIGFTELNYNVDKAHGGAGGFQVGSTFKPFVLAEWLKSGRSLDSMVNAPSNSLDPMSAFTACGQKLRGDPYKYSNAGSETNVTGRMSIRDATRNSVNTAYVSMVKQLDICRVAETAQSLGVFKGRAAHKNQDRSTPLTTELDNAFPSFVLGTQEVAPLDMAGAYAAFAAEGLHCRPVALLEVRNAKGEPLPVPGADCKQALEPNVARNVNEALQGTWTSGTAKNVRRIGRPVAGKTGTTNESKNVWFSGYTPHLAASVWVGHHEGYSSLNRERINGKRYRNVYGATIPAPIWADLVGNASKVLNLPADGFAPGSEQNLRATNPDGATRVPNVSGRSVSAARATLEAAGFSVEVSSKRVNSDKVRAGAVVSTSPGAGRSADPGDTVTIVRSAGPAPKPKPKPSAPAPNPAPPAPAPVAPAPAPAAPAGDATAGPAPAG
ncbi:transglycosylase domain-containing protein [Kineococcus sp. NUM-3379]